MDSAVLTVEAPNVALTLILYGLRISVADRTEFDFRRFHFLALVKLLFNKDFLWPKATEICKVSSAHELVLGPE